MGTITEMNSAKQSKSLFPFDCCGRLAGYIIYYPVNTPDLVDNPVGNNAQNFIRNS
jgi:hypothetical protein